jgi:RHS repeat-associated protein
VADRYTTTYGWDVLDRLTWIRDSNGNTFTNEYDALSRKLRGCTPDRGCTVTEYADDGLPIVETDAQKNQHRTVYDEAGRPLERLTIHASGAATRSVTYRWDADASGRRAGASVGRLVELHDQSTARVERRRRYDVMGRATALEDCVDGVCEATAQRYDLAGRLASVTYPGGATASYVYDARGLLTAIPTYATFLYDDSTYQPTQVIYGNGVIEHRTYDPARWWTDEIDLTANNGGFVERMMHGATGRVRGVETDRGKGLLAMIYAYDDLGRLGAVRSSDPTFDARYSYDGTGNLTRDSARGTIDYLDPDHPHAPTATSSGQQFSYDSLGQLVSSDRLTVTWDPDGNPIEIIDRATKAGARYSYDVDGQRVARHDATGTELRFGPLVEHDPSGQLVTYVMAFDRPIARRDRAGLAYLHVDHLGSVRTLTDAAGDVIDERDFSTWGAPVGALTVPGVTQAFSGGRLDADHGLVELGARLYDPATQVFLSADTVVPDLFAPQSLNAYSYAFNNPATLVDPSGHAPEDPDVYHDEELGVDGLDLTDPATRTTAKVGEVKPRGDDLAETTPAVSTSATILPRQNTIADRAQAVVDELTDLGREIDAIPHDFFVFAGIERDFKLSLGHAAVAMSREGMVLAGTSSTQGLYAELLAAVGPTVEAEIKGRDLYAGVYGAWVSPLASQRPVAQSHEPGALVEGGLKPVFVGAYDYGHGEKGIYGGVRAGEGFIGAGTSFQSFLFTMRSEAAVARRAYKHLTNWLRR